MSASPPRSRPRAVPRPIAGCEGLLVEPAPADVTTARARRLGATLARELPGRWRFRTLGPTTLRLERRDRPPTLAEGWTLARRLRARVDVLDAEPALRLPGLEPEPALRRALVGDLVTRSLGPTRPRPGTEALDWAIRLAGLDRAWVMFDAPGVRARRGAPGAGIQVGHPDTGYTRHPAIWSAPDGGRLRAAAGRDFVDDDGDAADPLDGMSAGHGTATGSVIMSDGRSGGPVLAVPGAAPGAALVPLRVSGSVVHLVSYANVVEALHAAVDRGCHVVSMSLGGPLPSRALHRALRRAEARGVLLVAAAGNVWPWVVYPGRYDEVLCLAACDIERRAWRRSSSGPEVDLAAPGVSVWHATATRRGFGRDRADGTSFATTLAAGTAALWLAWHGRRALIERFGPRGLGPAFRALARGAGAVAPPGWRLDRHGAGILDAARLLAAPLPRGVSRAARAARASRPVRQPAPERLVAALAETVPGLDAVGMRRALASLFDAHERGLERALQPFGDELRFHATLNPAFRAALRNAAAAGRRAGGTGARVAGAARAARRLREDPRLAREASPELLARLAR